MEQVEVFACNVWNCHIHCGLEIHQTAESTFPSLGLWHVHGILGGGKLYSMQKMWLFGKIGCFELERFWC
jgi:hypothetical protein